KKPPITNDDDFKQAMLDDEVLPLKSPLRYQKPIANKSLKKRSEPFQKLSLQLTAEPGDMLSVTKTGTDKHVLKSLKRTLIFDSTLDLHGLNKRDAANYLLEEINYYSNRSATLKIIHGKSAAPNSVPILKSMSK